MLSYPILRLIPPTERQEEFDILFIESVSEYTCRHPANDCVARDIRGYYRVSRNNSSVANMDPINHYHPRAYPYITTNNNRFTLYKLIFVYVSKHAPCIFLRIKGRMCRYKFTCRMDTQTRIKARTN